MKRVVIYNLKECFEFGMSFKELAEFEAKVQDVSDFRDEIALGGGVAEFVQAKIDKNGRFTLYYNFKPLF